MAVRRAQAEDFIGLPMTSGPDPLHSVKARAPRARLRRLIGLDRMSPARRGLSKQVRQGGSALAPISTRTETAAPAILLAQMRCETPFMARTHKARIPRRHESTGPKSDLRCACQFLFHIKSMAITFMGRRHRPSLTHHPSTDILTIDGTGRKPTAVAVEAGRLAIPSLPSGLFFQRLASGNPTIPRITLLIEAELICLRRIHVEQPNFRSSNNDCISVTHLRDAGYSARASRMDRVKRQKKYEDEISRTHIRP